MNIPGDSSEVKAFTIRYEPVQGEVRLINNGLMDVLEGSFKEITKEDLYMEMSTVKNFQFTILTGPEHGTVQLRYPNNGSISNSNASFFTNEDISSGKVIYQHDDSENDVDMFSFSATPILEQTSMIQELSEFSGTFEIHIMLKNDNPPKRAVNRVFNVVANRGRLITLDDLKYVDPDIEFDNSELKYQWHHKDPNQPNGEIVRASNHSIVLQTFIHFWILVLSGGCP